METQYESEEWDNSLMCHATETLQIKSSLSRPKRPNIWFLETSFDFYTF
jgi:hypothetical protein